MRGRDAACPCCGQLTLSGRGLCEICDVCDWEDDGYEDRRPLARSGPNGDAMWVYRIRYERPDASALEVREEFEALRAAEAARRLPGYLAELSRALAVAVDASAFVSSAKANGMSVRLWNDARVWDAAVISAEAASSRLTSLARRVPQGLEVVLLNSELDELLGAPRVPAQAVLGRWERVMAAMSTPTLGICTESGGTGLATRPFNDELMLVGWGALAV